MNDFDNRYRQYSILDDLKTNPPAKQKKYNTLIIHNILLFFVQQATICNSAASISIKILDQTLCKHTILISF